MADHSRRTPFSNWRAEAQAEQQMLTPRDVHPYLSARKLARLLQNADVPSVPASSTVHKILGCHGRLAEAAKAGQRPLGRFEHEAPNLLRQMDFKGEVLNEQRCSHPLTILGDQTCA